MKKIKTQQNGYAIVIRKITNGKLNEKIVPIFLDADDIKNKPLIEKIINFGISKFNEEKVSKDPL